MENLGDLCGLDYNTAYFLKYGKNAPMFKKYCKATPPDFDWETAYKSDEYHCWCGTRLPQWIY